MTRTPAIKFCGLTTPDDAAMAAALGAEYAGAVLAGGPRMLAASEARVVLAGAGRARRVVVLGTVTAAEAVRAAAEVQADVIQLHGWTVATDVASIRENFCGEVWGVAQVGAGGVASDLEQLFDTTDAVVLDARPPDGAGRAGGNGVSFDWEAAARVLEPLRAGRRLVVAGGLRPENVALAVRVLAPDVVDVSSGVERGVPGKKDHELMRRFAEAVQLARA